MPQQPLPLSQIQITLASAERIRQWAERTLPNGKRVGQVTNGGTLSHQTLKPEPNGLFCERIFGPLRDFQCACGKRDRPIDPNKPTTKRLYCKVCEVEFTWSVVRRYRMGYISLAAPVTHPWYIKPTPCWMGVFFDFKPSVIYGLVYGGQTLTLEHSLRHNLIDLDTTPEFEKVAFKLLQPTPHFNEDFNFVEEEHTNDVKRVAIRPVRMNNWRNDDMDNANYVTRRLTLVWPKKWFMQGTEKLWQTLYERAFLAMTPGSIFQSRLKKYRQSAIRKKVLRLFADASLFNNQNNQQESTESTTLAKLSRTEKLKKPKRAWRPSTTRPLGEQQMTKYRRFYGLTRLKLLRLKRLYQPQLLKLLKRLEFCQTSLTKEAALYKRTSLMEPLRSSTTTQKKLPLPKTRSFGAVYCAGVKRHFSGLPSHSATPRWLGTSQPFLAKTSANTKKYDTVVKKIKKKKVAIHARYIDALLVSRTEQKRGVFENRESLLQKPWKPLKSLKTAQKSWTKTFFLQKALVQSLTRTARYKLRKSTPTTPQTNEDRKTYVGSVGSVKKMTLHLPNLWKKSTEKLRLPLRQAPSVSARRKMSQLSRKMQVWLINEETLAGQLDHLIGRAAWALRPVTHVLAHTLQQSRWQNAWFFRHWYKFTQAWSWFAKMPTQQVFRQQRWNYLVDNYTQRWGVPQKHVGLQAFQLPPGIALPRGLRPFEPLRQQGQPIYTLSHRDRWPFEEEWLEFSAFMAPAPHHRDVPIPTYREMVQSSSARDTRDTHALFNKVEEGQDYGFNLPQTRQDVWSGSMSRTALPTGAGVLQRMLTEYTPRELRKQDQQNRTFFYNVIVRMRCLHQMVLLWRLQPDPKGKDRRGKWPKYGKRMMSRLKKAREGLLRRSKLVRKMMFMNTEPRHMLLSVLPVLPPDLRPIVQMGDLVTASDLNRLYQRVLHRNQILQDFLRDLDASDSFEIQYAQRMLQEAVDNLIENGKGGIAPECDPNGRPLKSLADVLKGKQGRFRQHLLGKRVDYSGRSVIVVGPQLRIHECGIPREMALELFLPFLLRAILTQKITLTVMGAKQFIRNYPLQTNQLLQEIMRNHPVVLNRAPTLHRLGFQAFQPRLVHGRAILLHPLVCPPFNADFDGDQMAVHVPITAEARAEAWKLMFTRNNLLSPATGDPIILPSQDMVLGCYYLTTWQRRFQKGAGRAFGSIADVLHALEQSHLDLHAPIWLRWRGEVKQARFEKVPTFPLELRVQTYGHVQVIFAHSQYQLDQQQHEVTLKRKRQDPWIYTTPGRVLFHSVVQQTLQTSTSLKKKSNVFGTRLLK